MKIALIILVSVVLILTVLYAWYGGFSSLNIRVEEQGGEVLVYEEIKGDYKQSAVVMDKIYYALRDSEQLETTKGFGIYYDNPQKVEKSQLRSEAGCILETSDSTLLAQLSEKYKVKTFPVKQYIVTEFPFKGKLSIMVSLFKVYPALNRYANKHNYTGGEVMEIYDIPNKKISYRQAIN